MLPPVYHFLFRLQTWQQRFRVKTKKKLQQSENKAAIVGELSSLSRTSFLHSIWVFTLSTALGRSRLVRLMSKHKQARCRADTPANPSFGGGSRLDSARDLKNSHNLLMSLADRLRICSCFQSGLCVSSPATRRRCVFVCGHQLRRPQMCVHQKYISLFVTVPPIKTVY